MSEKEHTELNIYLAQHVMGYRRTTEPDDHTTDGKTLFWHRPAGDKKEAVLVGRAYSHSGLTKEYGKEMFSHSWSFFSPTTDAAASMAVLKKCAEFLGTGRVHIYAPYGQFSFWMVSNAEVGRKIAAEASDETLELAIAKFAQKLFSTPKTVGKR